MANLQYICRVADGTLITGIQIPDTSGYWPSGFHPSTVDFYAPVGTIGLLGDIKYGMFFAHGGLGDAAHMARVMGVLSALPATDQNVAWGRLAAAKFFAVFANGTACKGNVNPWNPRGVNTVTPDRPLGTTGWQNRVMDCESDSLQFWKDCVAHFNSLYGLFGRYFVGYSEGAMMAARMIMESPATFGHYALIAGMPGTYYLGQPANAVKMYMEFGDKDINLTNNPTGLGAMFAAPTVEQSNPTIADINIPSTLIGPRDWFQSVMTANGLGAFHDSDGVTTVNSGGTNTRGTKTIWDYGPLRLFRSSDANHQIKLMEAYTGELVLARIISWGLSS